MTLQEKRDKRAALVNSMRALLNKASAEKRKMTADEETSYNAQEVEVDQLTADINREDKLAIVENSLRGRKDHNYRPDIDNLGGKKKKPGGKSKQSGFPENYGQLLFNEAQSYARVGKTSLSAEFANVLNEGVDTEGGYLVPEEFETRLIENLVNADPIRAAATVIRTGSDRNIPIEADTGAFTYIGENGSYSLSDPSFGRVILSAFKSGGIIKVSEELVQDTFLDLEAYLQRLASRRYNALEQSAFANGAGAGGPLGIFQTTSVAGTNVQSYTGAVSASAAITGDDIIETFHKLPRAYRDNASWLASDTLVKMVRKLKGEDNQYLWQPGLQAGIPDRLLGRPIFVSDGAPAPAVSGKSLAFGDWSFYYIADRIGISMQVLRELYAANGQVGYKFSRRSDGRMTSANAMVFFQHGAAA